MYHGLIDEFSAQLHLNSYKKFWYRVYKIKKMTLSIFSVLIKGQRKPESFFYYIGIFFFKKNFNGYSKLLIQH